MIRLILAEDQAMLLDAFEALLGLEEDIQIVGRAADGQQALQLAATLRPDVIITDIEMPHMTGIELAERVREQGLPSRVMIVTTFGRAGYLRRALQAGVRGYMLKDAPITQLADAIRKVAAGGRAIASDLAEAVWDALPDPLSDRERSMLRLAEAGRTNKDIAEELSLSAGTVRNYFSEIVQKLDARNRIEAGRIARQNGWL
ncbi:two component transcriptional regulator LuxR [Gluconobacter thailandicus F149-1 = NBRC 100600]|uniref:Two component response regulator n=1 Tax=Gluconobacter thailandicus NBRC 3257 TaxID=1381097 RepID=A0ABQ0IUN9_GLUTH|nr:response regulator transcription factor [Gluconobacter thailandicus]KXV53771.1 transcriptional regulator [Gluconobacter thailandicus]GAC86371.1 two component response regulator [Gluconobacter thailandicus NBRC 3255]GAD25932.1 two component response regulator [Gluconobacter thailandicus NBRC 3257]GAN94131.1 two component transcriptional regulator LuxR [Gluconobacter thailandicus F149-1 = NBRC 100600]GBR58746.1 two component response regulator [Gluconobacter thailandicus F149-1 = NBRC 100600]